MTVVALLRELEAHGVTLTLQGDRLKLAADVPPPERLLKAMKEHKAELIAALSIPRLPWQLERLVRAASSDLLPAREAIELGPGQFVMDLNRHTLAWAAAYLKGDREEALKRLWQAHHAWQGVN